MQGHYSIEYSVDANSELVLAITKDTNGNTSFVDTDRLHNVTDDLLHKLIDEGAKNSWFSKLPSHEQLMKRVRHTFLRLAMSENETCASLTRVLMTPKVLTLVWTPSVSKAPPMCFDESESELESEPELQESSLPPVALKDAMMESREEYLLTRLRAAKARVEEEYIRMQYFETTGRMPPDSESEDEDEDE